VRRRLLGLLALAALFACGRKGDPLPPIIEVPETTTDLSAYQDVMEVVLNWSYPQLTRAGRQLTDLVRVELWRMVVPPGQDESAAGPQAQELRRRLMLGRGTLIVRLEGEALVGATRGGKLEYRDPLPALPVGGRPLPLWYAVRSRRRDGTVSALSNVVSWQPRAVPAVVTGLQAEPREDGITLRWAEATGAAYVVQRQREGDSVWEIASPIGITTTQFLDASARQGQVWRYRVRAIVKAAVGPTGAEVVVPYPDVYPPAAVTGLVCLPEPESVRLRWDSATEPRVTYLVLRRLGSGDWVRLAAALQVAEYADAAPPGGEVAYAVKAVDEAGNQSAPTMCSVRTGS
jgi:nitrous oxide reductase accessory protein NosL